MMKHLIVFFLLFSLAANAFSVSGLCLMEHDVVLEQPLSMPCHDSAKDNAYDPKPHLCECDKCAQYAHSIFSITVDSPPVEVLIFSELQHKSLEFSPKYRPPIYFSV